MSKKPGYLRIALIAFAALAAGVSGAATYISQSKERIVLATATLVSLRYNAGLTDQYCDSAARLLQSFLLEYFDIESVQTNMALQYGGSHSALTVKIDGKEAYVDPYYGFAAIGDDGHLVSIADLWANLSGGKPLSKSLRQIALIPDITYYEKWHQNHLYFSDQGSPMALAMKIPKLKGRNEVRIGIPNNSSRDVYMEGDTFGYTTYWTYLGYKYDPTWTRSATASENVTFEATAIGDIDPDIIKSDPPPAYINGSRVGWNLSAGQTLTLFQQGVDGNQDVDYWTVKPRTKEASLSPGVRLESTVNNGKQE